MRDFLIWCSKYISIPALLVLAVIFYILFVQDYSVERIYENDRTIDSLKRVIAVETDTLNLYKERNRLLDNRDPEMVEKVVREQHNMSLPTEEIYVFTDNRDDN